MMNKVRYLTLLLPLLQYDGELVILDLPKDSRGWACKESARKSDVTSHLDGGAVVQSS